MKRVELTEDIAEALATGELIEIPGLGQFCVDNLPAITEDERDKPAIRTVFYQIDPELDKFLNNG